MRWDADLESNFKRLASEINSTNAEELLRSVYWEGAQRGVLEGTMLERMKRAHAG